MQKTKVGNGIKVGKEDDGKSVSTLVNQPLRKLKTKDFELMQFSCEHLESLRKKFDGAQIVNNEIGLQLDAFVSNVRGIRPVPISNQNLMLVRTRSNLFLVSNVPPETLYDLSPYLMNCNLRRRAIIKAGTGKHLWVLLLSVQDFRLIESAAVMMRRAIAGRPSIPSPTLAPDVSKQAVDISDFRQKLSRCQMEESVIMNLSVTRFAEAVSFVTAFKDGEDREHYYLIAGKEELSYRLYVNQAPSPNPALQYVTKLKFGSDSATLYYEL